MYTDIYKPQQKETLVVEGHCCAKIMGKQERDHVAERRRNQCNRSIHFCHSPKVFVTLLPAHNEHITNLINTKVNLSPNIYHQGHPKIFQDPHPLREAH